LVFYPLRPLSRHVATIALAGHHPFLKLSSMDKLPYRAVVDLQPALSKLADQPAQGEITAPDPSRYPRRILARNRFRPVTCPSCPARRCQSRVAAVPSQSPCLCRSQTAWPPDCTTTHQSRPPQL